MKIAEPKLTAEQLDELINRLDEIAVRNPRHGVRGEDGEHVPENPDALRELGAFDDALTQSQRVALAEELGRRWDDTTRRDGSPWLLGAAYQEACVMARGPRSDEDVIRITREVAESQGGTLYVAVWDDWDEFFSGKAPRDSWDDDGTMPRFDLDGAFMTYCVLPNGEALDMDVEPTGAVGMPLSRAQLEGFAGKLRELGVSAEAMRQRSAVTFDAPERVH